MNPFEPVADQRPVEANRPGLRPTVLMAWMLVALIVTVSLLRIVARSDQVAAEAVPMCGAADVEIADFRSDGALGTQYATLTFTVIADEPCWPMTIDAAEISTADGPLADKFARLSDGAVQLVDVVRPLGAGERFYIQLRRGSQCVLDAVDLELRRLTSLLVYFGDETARWPIDVGGCGGASVSQPSLRPQPDVPLYLDSSSRSAFSLLEIPVWMPATEPALPEDSDVSFFATGPRSWVLAWRSPRREPSIWSFRIEGHDADECRLPDLPAVVDLATGKTYVVAEENHCEPANAEVEEMPGSSWYWQDADQLVTFRARMSPPPHLEDAPMTHDELLATLASMTQIIDLREDPVGQPSQ